MARRRKLAEPLATIWRADDTLWAEVEKVLAEYDPPAQFGPDRIDQRKALDGVIHRMRSGVQWNHLPAEFGDDASVHRTFQRWVKRGVLTEAGGGPVAVVVTGANVHDSLLLADALEAVIVEPPDPVTGPTQHLCLDKAFSGAPSDATARVYGYQPHVRQIGEEKLDPASGEKKHPARRWVVERTIGWLNRCRGILVRYEKKAENYLAVVQLACALLRYRRLHRLTT